MHDERDEQHHKQARDNGHDLDRPVPQRIHAGVNNADRDKAEHDPVLDACVLVDQIVPGSMQRQHLASVPALREIVTQRVERFIGQIGAAAQLREEIIDRFLAAVLTVSLAVEHNAPVRVDNIVVARALESAANLLNESPYKKMLADRYASFDSGKGKEFEDGKLKLEDVVAYAKTKGEPKQTSGKQELYEAILNMYC